MVLEEEPSLVAEMKAISLTQVQAVNCCRKLIVNEEKAL